MLSATIGPSKQDTPNTVVTVLKFGLWLVLVVLPVGFIAAAEIYGARIGCPFMDECYVPGSEHRDSLMTTGYLLAFCIWPFVIWRGARRAVRKLRSPAD